MSIDAQLLRESFAKAKPIAGQVADYFYQNLFEDFPEAESFFENTNLASQKKLLIKSLAFIIDNVDNGDRLVPYLQDMGARHLRYGVEEEHYPWVGQVLLKTLAHFLADEWTPALENAWTSAFEFISATMLEGARKGKSAQVRRSPKVRSSNVVSLHRDSASVHLEIELPSELRLFIAQQAALMVDRVIIAEFNKAIDEEITARRHEDVLALLNKAS